MMNWIKTIWDFSRPHTLIGSFFSITAIYLMAALPFNPLWYWDWVWLPALVSALACNIYITGLNQWSDADLDQLNKPWLPIPSGRLSRKWALYISLFCLGLALAVSLNTFSSLFQLILLISAVGTVYSLPPLKLKRHHLGAAFAIMLVRGLLVNLGFFLIFRRMIFGQYEFSLEIKALTVFMVLFGLGIAWMKDIHDTEGDRAFKIGTLSVKFGRERAFMFALFSLALAYASVLLASALEWIGPQWYYNLTHALPLLFMLWKARNLIITDPLEMRSFYRFIWILFFIEYIVFAFGAFIA
jgi:homogentisate phytyltransferase/homogentisate geranylgeranyltransferase